MIRTSMTGNAVAKGQLNGYLDGMSEQRQDVYVEVSGGKVYLDAEAVGGGDIDYWIDGKKYKLDCTSGDGVNGRARVELNQGTTAKPAFNIVYASYNEADNTFKLSKTTTPPAGYFAPVAIAAVQDATTVNANGPLVLHPTTEAMDFSGKGMVSWILEKLKAIGAHYFSGIDTHIHITTNAGALDDIGLNTSNGIVFQSLREDWPDYDISTDGIWVANASGNGVLTEYQKLTNLNSALEVENGTALNDGDSITPVIWAAISDTPGNCKLFLTLPKDRYTVDDDAVIDKNNYAIKTFPNQFKTAGFLLCQLVLKYNTVNGGTWTNLLTTSVDVWDADTKDESSPNYPNNYPNNSDVTITLTKTGASKVRVHFNDFNTEANYDFVKIYNAADVLQATYSGNLAAFTSVDVVGTTIKIKFTSDSSVVRKGWHIDALEYATASVSGADVIDLRR